MIVMKFSTTICANHFIAYADGQWKININNSVGQLTKGEG